MSMTVTASGRVFEVSRDLIDVTSWSRPDTAWRHVDERGHTHQWHDDSGPARNYRPDVRYTVPTLVRIVDGYGYWPDGGRYEEFHCECRECGAHVEPGYKADDTTQFVPGIASYLIDGRSVSREEFEREAAAELGLPGGERP